MSLNKNKPETLEELLSATPSKLKDWAANTEPIRDPVSLEADERFARALTEDPQVLEPVAATGLSWWQRLVQTRILLPALVGATALILVLWSPWSQPTQQPPNHLIPKGRPLVGGEAPISLHLGQWLPQTKKVKRLQDKEKLRPHANILFGFSLKKKGFVYLFAQTGKKPIEFLYPGGQQTAQAWSKGFHNLESGGQALSYKLPGQKTTMVFVAVTSQKLLSKQQLKSIRSLQTLHLIHRSPLQGLPKLNPSMVRLFVVNPSTGK